MKRLTPDMLLDRMRVFDVDDLEAWDRNPNQGDVGAISRSMATFGQLDVVLVSGGVIRAGNHRVEAERASREFGGRIAGIDISDLGWDDTTLDAASIALNYIARLSTDDEPRLALLALQIHEQSQALLAATGIDDEDLDRLVADVLRDTNPALAAALDQPDIMNPDTQQTDRDLHDHETAHDEPNISWNPHGNVYDLPVGTWNPNTETGDNQDKQPEPQPIVTFAVAIPKNLRHPLTRQLKTLMNQTQTFTMGAALAAHFGLLPES